MAKKKYYAVKNGLKVGIFETWEECEMQIKGFSGAVYKSFASKEDAEKFISGVDSDAIDSDNNKEEVSVDSINDMVQSDISNLGETEVIAFVDGSYSSSDQKSGFGVIIIDNKGVQIPLYKAFVKQLSPEFIELHNVAAELEGVKEAINWAIAYGKTHIKIFYDYEGIGKWADGTWSAKKEITKQYVNFIKDKRILISIDFFKVPAHSGIEFNEMADKLAREALLEKGYKTYNDGSIYFVGYTAEDWKAIIECINEERSELFAEKNNTVNVEVQVINNRKRLVVTDDKNRVVINAYSVGKSYVQGKQSVLFQMIISRAVEMMRNEQTVIETLNRVHVLTLTKEEIEVKFEELLPHYNGIRSGKHYNNLLSAVYNTMLVGYMPDYTSLVTPLFRTYEYFLHRILGDKMQLNTSDANGRNNFSYFSKDSTGKYECNSSEKCRLSTDQLLFLNDLYNTYNRLRHPYSHWSVDDYDTAVITSLKVAQDYLKEGLTLADRYYRLF